MINVFIPITISFYVWIYPHRIGTYLYTVAMCFIFHTIEMVSVLLTFAFNKQYYNLFCKLCDNGCTTFLKHIAEKELKLDNTRKNALTVSSHTPASATLTGLYNTSITQISRTISGAITRPQPPDPSELAAVTTQESMVISSLDTMNLSKYSNPTGDHDAEDPNPEIPRIDTSTFVNDAAHISVHTGNL